MIQQGLDFIDGQVIGGSNIYEPGTTTPTNITESKTYIYTIRKSVDGGVTYSEPLFIGNKFLMAGDERLTLELTDFIRFNIEYPSYANLNTLNNRKYYTSGIISYLKWDVYDGGIETANRIAGNTASVACIYRYPNRNSNLEFTVADPTKLSQYPNYDVFSSLIQGCDMDNSTRGVIGDVYGYRLLPRFPRYVHSGDTTPSTKCYLGLQVYHRNNDGINVYALYDGAKYADYRGTISNTPNGITSGYVQISEISGLADGIGLMRVTGSEAYINSQRVCDIDSSPCSRYYLMWQDRFGGYQCQPFCKGNTYTESFESAEIKNYSNNRSVIQVDIQPQWEINTKWIDEDIYPIYESIFTSKFLVLIDTVEGAEYEVILKDKQYTEKTFRNQGRKLFNLKLTLEKNDKQQITY